MSMSFFMNLSRFSHSRSRLAILSSTVSFFFFVTEVCGGRLGSKRLTEVYLVAAEPGVEQLEVVVGVTTGVGVGPIAETAVTFGSFES